MKLQEQWLPTALAGFDGAQLGGNGSGRVLREDAAHFTACNSIEGIFGFFGTSQRQLWGLAAGEVGNGCVAVAWNPCGGLLAVAGGKV